MISVSSQSTHCHSKCASFKKWKYYVFPSKERLTNYTIYKKAERRAVKFCV